MARSGGKSGVQFGYKLMSETTGPHELVRNAKLAEDAGFDHVVLLAAGPDQEGLIRFFEQTLSPELRALKSKSNAGGKAKTSAQDKRSGQAKATAKRR